ncbi:MAG: DNA-binding domain-containing protein [Schlesneria sp.]
MPDSSPLNTIQRWLQAVITHPEGVRAGVDSPTARQLVEVTQTDVERVILPSREMTSLDRLQIYGRAYFGRLLECLAAQFPAVRHAVGEEAFNGLAFGYLVDHPSKSYSISTLGSSFDEYLTATRPPRSDEVNHETPDFADFLIELARLERVYAEVFDGPGPERSLNLNANELAGLSPQEFAESHLVFHSCVRLLELRFPVHEYATAIRRGLEPTPPVARPINLVITRRDYIVRRFEVTKPQFRLLTSLMNGETVGEALIQLLAEPTSDAVTLQTDLQSWFREWSAAPLFAELVRSPEKGKS